MVKETGLYDELEVSPTASEQEIKTAYRKMALKYHPDKNSDPGAAEKFKKVAEAYEILSDSARRQRYDQFGRAGEQGAGGGGAGGFPGGGAGGFGPDFDPMDIFSQFFGFGGGGGGGGAQRQQQRRRKPPFIMVELQCSLEELYCGTRKVLAVRRYRRCTRCKGHGTATGRAPPACRACRGTGKQHIQFGGGMLQAIVCQQCRGAGKATDVAACPLCAATAGTAHQGLLLAEKRITVVIPPGAEDSDSFVFAGDGDEAPGMDEAGDVLVVVEELAHPHFRRINASDLVLLNARAALRDVLASGFALPVEHLDGRLLHLRLPEGAGGAGKVPFFSGTHVYIADNEGMPVKGADGGGARRGRLFVPVELVFPDSLSEEQLTAIERALGYRAPAPPAETNAAKTAPRQQRPAATSSFFASAAAPGTVSATRETSVRLRPFSGDVSHFKSVDEAGNAKGGSSSSSGGGSGSGGAASGGGKKKKKTAAQRQQEEEQEQQFPGGAGQNFGFGGANVHVQRCDQQ